MSTRLKHSEHTPAGSDASSSSPRLVAVIDIGTSSIRMAIGEIAADGQTRTIETLTQAVAIGRDTFTGRKISRSTIEGCVRVLSSYRVVLDSYGISRDDQLRCVATSAVREAQNRLVFLDRIYIATRIQVEVLDQSEVARITFLGVQQTLKADPHLSAARSFVVEVGGGNTEFLVVENGQVTFSHTCSLGSLRLRKMMESLKTPIRKEREFLENQIDRFVSQALQQVETNDELPTELIALGGDFRFAAEELSAELDENSLATIPINTLQHFVDKMLPLSVDELVHDFHLTFPDAETLGPALLTMVNIARRLNADQLRVSDVNLRDGLLAELASDDIWSGDFRDHIFNAAIDLGSKYSFEENHARHVANLAGKLFDALQMHHRLDARSRVMLTLASLLHEIGMYVSISSYHKHSMYLIQNSELFGLSQLDLQIVGMVARYHRRASPKPTHLGYSSLSREDRVVIAKLASILRVADALDRSYSQRIRDFTCAVQKDWLIITIPGIDDLSLEQIAMKQTAQLFEETYGLSVLMRRSKV
ncbi:MAG: HD domain-containing protein [Rhodopirellula sp.]|nr:HD domain-containing protein [Rhodopirellula sp.]